MHISRTITTIVLIFATLVVAGVARAAGFGSTFTYQGELRDGSGAVNGVYDMQFTLWDAEVGGTLASPTAVAINGVGVSNGRFTVDLNFGAPAFNGDARWLRIGIKAAGGGTYQWLTPRQRLAPAPHALVAGGLALPVGASGDTDDALVQSGLLRITQAGSSNAIYAQASGVLGSAGYFISTHADNDDLTLQVKNNGAGTGIFATSAEFRAGHFEITNATNPHIALYASTQGTGTALYGYSTGSGYGVQGANNGSGSAARFLINNVNNDADALIAETSGDGAAVYARNTGNGAALEVDGPIRVSGAGNNTNTPMFRHTVTAGNLTQLSDGSYRATVIDNPMCNGRPNAMLMVTEVVDPDGAWANIRVGSLAVAYDASSGHWRIVSQPAGGEHNVELGDMEEGDRFNVMVVYP